MVKLYRWLWLFLVAWFIADSLLIYLKPFTFPPVVQFEKKRKPNIVRNGALDFQFLVAKNLFSAETSIPDSLKDLQNRDKKPEGESQKNDDTPVPSLLPLTLLGTIVHSNPEKSIANVELKSKNLTMAVRVGHSIVKLAKLEAVERGRAYIRNLSTGRLEYIELKDVGQLRFSSASKTVGAETTGEVKQVAPNKFEVSRAEVNKYTSDLSNVLQQAAMIPVRGSSGEIQGFRFVNIQPDSIYTQLGFQVGDVIKSVNGEFVDSPAKALELYNALKGSNSIKLTIERNGQEQDIEYNIK